MDFNSGWTVQPKDGAAVSVDLPHDAMIHETRRPDTSNGPNSGHFPGGLYTYRKRFVAPEEWQAHRVSVFFEGIYHRSQILLNGQVVGGRPSGYAEFHVDLNSQLKFGDENELVVIADTAGEPNSRWYSGSGIYRKVWLDVEKLVRLARDAVSFSTVAVNDSAQVRVQTHVELDELLPDAGLTVSIELRAGARVVAQGSQSIAQQVGKAAQIFDLTVAAPQLWSSDSPHLYDLVVTLRAGDQLLDERRVRVGIRTIELDPARGLRINGVETKLRGACIHHDHGVLGAATFRAAEFRRARLLKDAGFNSIRAGHAPVSRDCLDACDAVGLYLIDELTDIWFVAKTPHDYAQDFKQWWREDLRSMIDKDRNHASVIMYSIGNENGESALPEGVAVGREMADLCRELDPTRTVTAGINPTVSSLAKLGVNTFDAVATDAKNAAKKKAKPSSKPKKESAVGSAFFNMVMTKVGSIMNSVGALGFADRAVAAFGDSLDVVGYNYGAGAYKKTTKRHPGWVILGTESLPPDIAKNWRLVESLPHLIGDFMWTGWDHLGEAGLQGWAHGAGSVPSMKPYPFVLSGGGALDLSGAPTAIAYLAQAAWKLDRVPQIVVRPLDVVGKPFTRSPWRPTDAIAAWTWPGYEGVKTEVLVYSSAPFVELQLNGVVIGKKPTDHDKGCTAQFTVAYQAGALVARALDATGKEISRHELTTALPKARLELRIDQKTLRADGQDLGFIEILITDDNGIVLPLNAVELRATVRGAARLQGLGSANPEHTESYTDDICTTYYGSALAVIRAGTEVGEAFISVAAEGFETVDLTIAVNAQSSTAIV